MHQAIREPTAALAPLDGAPPEVAGTGPAPRVSVIVRSYNRLPALCELLDQLLVQRFDGFEIVVVEQSTRASPAERAALARRAEDPRVRVLRFPPLGGPRARNEGVRAARGELILLIDDDDLPGGDGWIAAHVRNFDDPCCLGVSGRSHVDDGKDPPYRGMRRAERLVMSLSWLGWQRPYPRVKVRKRIDSLHGSNASMRRSTIERAGLWDECTPVEDELSFAYRLRQRRRPGEYLVFDPDAVMRRRLDIPGGMDKRYLSIVGFGWRTFLFLHQVLAYYLPWRFVLLYPAYAGYLYVLSVDWVFGESHTHRTVPHKLWTATWFLVALPGLWLTWLARHAVRRLRHGPLEHEPRL